MTPAEFRRRFAELVAELDPDGLVAGVVAYVRRGVAGELEAAEPPATGTPSR